MLLELMKISNGRAFVCRTLVQHDVIDGDIQGMLGERGLDLVGAASSISGRPICSWHVHDVALGGLLLRVLLHHFVGGDLAVNLDGAWLFLLWQGRRARPCRDGQNFP